MRGPESKARRGVGHLTFLVTVPSIKGVTQEQWKYYIEDAVSSWGGSGFPLGHDALYTAFRNQEVGEIKARPR